MVHAIRCFELVDTEPLEEIFDTGKWHDVSEYKTVTNVQGSTVVAVKRLSLISLLVRL